MDQKSSREVLKNKVVDLVKQFIRTNGGISISDLERLFGYKTASEVAATLSEISIMIV